MDWDILQGAGWSLLFQLPLILFWTAVLIIGIRMMRRNDGKAEKYIVIGGSIKLGAIFLTVALQYSGISLFLDNGDVDRYITLSEIFRWVLDIISIAGYLCLFYAFWVKSTSRKKSSLDISSSPREPYVSDSGLPNQPR